MLLADDQKQREKASLILQQCYIIQLRELIYGGRAVETMYHCFCAHVIVKDTNENQKSEQASPGNLWI